MSKMWLPRQRPALGQKWKSHVAVQESALPPKADIHAAVQYVRLVPIADIRLCRSSVTICSALNRFFGITGLLSNVYSHNAWSNYPGQVRVTPAAFPISWYKKPLRLGLRQEEDDA